MNESCGIKNAEVRRTLHENDNWERALEALGLVTSASRSSTPSQSLSAAIELQQPIDEQIVKAFVEHKQVFGAKCCSTCNAAQPCIRCQDMPARVVNPVDEPQAPRKRTRGDMLGINSRMPTKTTKQD